MAKVLVDYHELGVRIAVVDDGLVGYYASFPEERQTIGNLYKAKVENVLSAMEAAFVNIGMEKKAFLQGKDIPQGADEHKPIQKLIRPGDEILVQVMKEPFSTKGAGVTADVKLSGRLAVLIPLSQLKAVSKQIDEPEERERLRRIIDTLCPAGMGVILRTQAAGKSEEEIKAELDILLARWERVKEKALHVSAPRLIEGGETVLGNVLKRIGETDEVIVNSPAGYREIMDTMEECGGRAQVQLVEDGLLFDSYGLEGEIERLSYRRVRLDCGGEVVFDTAEALTAVDVNTARARMKDSKEESVLAINLAAAEEIARQLRLRNIGGMIVIDFIDMDRGEDRERVIERLKEALSADPVQTEVYGMTRMGLVEMTRKRTVNTASGQQPCTRCKGTGRVLRMSEVLLSVRRDLLRLIRNTDMGYILIEGSQQVVNALKDSELLSKEPLENVEVYLRQDRSYKHQEYRVRALIRQDMECLKDAFQVK